MKSVEDYHKGYIDGMSVNHKYPQLLMIAGYSFGQILKLVFKDQEEKTMTRKEAISKCHGISNPECLVQALEALGLLKFDEPQREIEVLFSEQCVLGKIELETWSDKGLTLKVYGKIVYQHNK